MQGNNERHRNQRHRNQINNLDNSRIRNAETLTGAACMSTSAVSMGASLFFPPYAPLAYLVAGFTGVSGAFCLGAAAENTRRSIADHAALLNELRNNPRFVARTGIPVARHNPHNHGRRSQAANNVANFPPVAVAIVREPKEDVTGAQSMDRGENTAIPRGQIMERGEARAIPREQIRNRSNTLDLSVPAKSGIFTINIPAGGRRIVNIRTYANGGTNSLSTRRT